ILQDWADGISFEDEEIDKERGVVESELRSGLNANQRMRNEYLPVIFSGSRYADRLPIGTREVINNAPYDALKRFYRDWYRPDLMSLVVVGDVDLDEVEQQIKDGFASLENPDDPRERERYGFPDHEETLIAITKDKEATFTTGRVMIKHDHEKVKTVGDYRTSLVRSTYNRMLNARLDELRQQAEPPFLYGYSGYGREVGDLDTYTSFVSAGEGEIEKALKAVLEENKRVLLHGFTASELERTKAEMLSAAETTAKEEDKTESGQLSMSYVYHFLNDNPAMSPNQRLMLMQALLPSIQLAEVNALGQKWITDENRVIVITGPDKEEVPLPTEQDVLDLIAEVDAADIAAYEDNVSEEPLLSALPAAGAVVSSNEVPSVGVTELTLSNGIRVILKPTDFQNDEISFTAFSPGGHSLYDDEEYRTASLASAIVNQSGIGSFNLVQLQKQLAGKQVQVGPYIGEYEEGLQGFSTIADQETMFQLIHLYFTAPRRDDEAFNSFMTRQKQILQNLLVNPNYYFQDRFSKLKFNGHIRRGLPTAEQMETVDLDRLMQVYADRFSDASDFTFVMVGNIDVAEITPHLEQYLGSLPATNRNEKWRDPGVKTAKGQHIDRFNYGEAPKAQVRLNWYGDFEWDIRENRYHFSAMQEVLRNRLRESMREDQGGVYGVSVGGGVSKIPNEGYQITIGFNAEPDQVDTLLAVAKSEIAKVVSEGASEEDLGKVREVQKQSRIKNQKENGYWTNTLKSYYLYGLDLGNLSQESYEKLVDALTGEDVMKMAAQVFGTENYIESVMMPEE
nr:insulinase family protein [Saprospiraceae bacterium]